MKKSFVVETVSTFRIKYLVKSENEIKQQVLQRLVDESKVPELDQEFLGEKIVGVYETTDQVNEQLILDLDRPVPEEILDDAP